MDALACLDENDPKVDYDNDYILVHRLIFAHMGFKPNTWLLRYPNGARTGTNSKREASPTIRLDHSSSAIAFTRPNPEQIKGPHPLGKCVGLVLGDWTLYTSPSIQNL